MTFLAPAAGLIGAAIAVPALLLFYFLKLRRRPLRVSSTLLWEQSVQDLQVNEPFRLLRITFLFLIQLLALACLLIALARPAIGGEPPTGSRVVILIDRSASMSAADGTRTGAKPAADDQPPFTRLDQARAEALRIIENLRRSPGVGPGRRRPEAMIISLAADARAITNFTSDSRELRDAVRSIQPTDQPGDLAAAMRLVYALGAGAEDVTPGRGVAPDRLTVFLISDGSLADPPRENARRPLDFRFVRTGPAAALRPDNLGIVAVSAKRDPDDATLARLFVRVQNSGPADVPTVLRCRVGDSTELLTTPITIPAATSTADAAASPGEAAATFEVHPVGDTVVVVSIQRKDLLASDDAAAVLIRRPSRPRVLVVSPDGNSTDPFLLSALEAMELAQIRTMDAAAFDGSSATTRDADAPAVVRPPYDLIIFDRVQPAAMPAIPSLSFGAGLPIPGLTISRDPSPTDPAERPRTTRFASWRRTHPVLRYVALDSIIIAPPMRLSLPASIDSPDTQLALGADGPLIVLVEPSSAALAAPHLLVAFELMRSNWGPDTSFPVFIANAVEYLTARDRLGRGSAPGPGMGLSYTTRDPITLVAPPGVTQVDLSGPADVHIDLPADPAALGSASANVSISLGILERVGVYRALLGNGSPQPLSELSFPVNLADPRESALAVNDHPPFGPATASRQPTEAQPAVAAPPEGGAREIWPWFVAAAGLLLTIEWFVYAWRLRA